MRIAVLVKQVPATDNVRIDEKTGTMIRNALESELNPLDMYAVEEAVRLKEAVGETTVTAITMGPPQAAGVVRDAISIGCDGGYLLSDRGFAGADTLATAYPLKLAIEKAGGFDLILTGERATDGETGQVGPSVAAQLDIPVVTYVSRIEKITRDGARVWRAIEGGHEIVEVELPALLSVVKEVNEPRLPNLEGKLRARSAEVPAFTAEDLEAVSEKIGLSGSPTRVVKVFYPKLSREGKIVRVKDPEAAVEELIGFMKEKGIV